MPDLYCYEVLAPEEGEVPEKPRPDPLTLHALERLSIWAAASLVWLYQ